MLNGFTTRRDASAVLATVFEKMCATTQKRKKSPFWILKKTQKNVKLVVVPETTQVIRRD